MFIFFWVIYLYIAYQIFFNNLRFNDFQTTLTYFTLLSILLIIFSFVYWKWLRPRKHKKAESSISSPSHPKNIKSSIKTISFNVAGTTFPNDDGTSRQRILRAIKFGDAPYANTSGDMDIHIEESSFEGETAFEVYINDYQIGYVPKSKIAEVKKAFDTFTCTEDSAEIVGGGNTEDGSALSYGCIVTISYIPN